MNDAKIALLLLKKSLLYDSKDNLNIKTGSA